MLPQQSLMLAVAAEALRDARWNRSPGAFHWRLDRDRARPEHDQLSSPLVAGRPGTKMEPNARDRPRARRTRSLDRRAEKRSRAGAHGQPDHRVAGRHGRQPDRARIPYRRAQLHGLVRRNVWHAGARDRGRLASPRRARFGRRGRGRSGRRSSRCAGPATTVAPIHQGRERYNYRWWRRCRSGSLGGCDGAVALVLKRLDDARRDGDRVYAVLGDVDGDLDRLDRVGHGRLDVGYLEVQAACPLAPGDVRGLRGINEVCARQASTCALGSLAGDLGQCGAAAGLAASRQGGMLCVHEQRPFPATTAGWPHRFAESGSIPAAKPFASRRPAIQGAEAAPSPRPDEPGVAASKTSAAIAGS